MSYLHQLSDLLFSPRYKTTAALQESVKTRYQQKTDLAFYSRIASHGLYEHEATLLPHLKNGETLVVGAGAGREVFALEAAGFSVHGVDTLPAMIQAAQAIAMEKKSAASFSYEIPDQLYSTIWITAHLTSHIPTRKMRIAFLTNLSTRLKHGGVLLLRPDLMCLRPLGRFWLASQILRLRSYFHEEWWEPGDTVRGYLGYPSSGLLFYHYFSEDEVRLEISAAGLTVSHQENGFWLLTQDKETDQERST